MSKGNKSKIDNLGRVLIPKSIRKALGIQQNEEITMYVEDNKLIISKGFKSCSLCGNHEVNYQLNDKLLCKSCVEGIKGL